MSKQTFIEDFELFVKQKIQNDFEENKYLDFTLDFNYLLQNYFKSFIQNDYYVEILVNEAKEEIFSNFYYLVSNLENFNTQYYNINRKFDSLIYEIDEQNTWNIETLTMIVNKLNLCKKSI